MGFPRKDGAPVLPVGTGTATATPSGVLHVSTTQVATGNNTDETDLATYSLPANTLSRNGQALRITLSCQALRQGYVEGNPLLPSSCAGIVAVKSATTGIAVPLVWRVRERRIAPWLAAALVIAPAVAAVHNWRVSG